MSWGDGCTACACSPTMIKYGINNIRELVGHKVNLQMVYDSPMCRLDTPTQAAA